MPYLTAVEAQRITIEFAKSIERKVNAQDYSLPQTCLPKHPTAPEILISSNLLKAYNFVEHRVSDLILKITSSDELESRKAQETLSLYNKLRDMTSGENPAADPSLYALKMIAILSCLFPKEAVEASQEITPLDITDQILGLFGAHTDHPDS